MKINKGDYVNLIITGNISESVEISVNNLIRDFWDTMGVTLSSSADNFNANIEIMSRDSSLPKEGYGLFVNGDTLHINGADDRGTIYGIYTVSEMLGVSPWHFMADVPKKKRDSFEIAGEFALSDSPVIPYRGIFINDEEELEKWVKLHMDEDTIGVKTYEKIFELLLRLKLNYLWPAMHVNSFNANPENGRLATKMGIIIGTSHCDMLMRSNNREWLPWLKNKGYEGIEYDYSKEGRNREVLKEYWRESVQQNKDLEVTYTLGMRGVHDSGFNTESLKGLSGAELLAAKTALLEEVILDQKQILKEETGEKALKIFIPYKEVLELYDNGLRVPEDITLVWVNDNYGYIRRYPSDKEKERVGGNGIYYHNSYWAPPGNSYMFINSIPLAHTKNELTKAYNEGIQKLWVTNFGTIKPFEEQLSYFASLAWETGKDNPKTDDVDAWLTNWLEKTFNGLPGKELAGLLNDFDQLTNVRKVEHLTADCFPMYEYGDEGAHRLHQYIRIVKRAGDIYENLSPEDKDSFFQLVLMRLHAGFFSNAMFYYADRSVLCNKQKKNSASRKYARKAYEFDILRRKLLYYYSNVMSNGKWSGILTPEDFPPPRTAMYPPAMPALKVGAPSLIVTSWGGSDTITFNGRITKWLELANAGIGKASYAISAPSWLYVSESVGTVDCEKRIFIRPETDEPAEGVLKVHSPNLFRHFDYKIVYKPTDNKEEDGRIVIEAESFKNASKGARVIKRLGRGEGTLLELSLPHDYAEYEPDITEETKEAVFVLHRFPTLNSVGRIRAKITVDNTCEYEYEAAAFDEHIANWKDNVQNNVDISCPIRISLTKGKHIIKIEALDKYIAFSRFVLFLKDEKRTNLALPCYGEDLPEEFETRAFARRFYGDIELSPRNEVFKTFADYSNANDDYDDYRPGVKDVSIGSWDDEFAGNVKRMFDSSDKPFEYDIDTAAALKKSKYAYITDPCKVIEYCTSPSYGGVGIGLYIREKGLRFTSDNAPKINYTFNIAEDKEYTFWLYMFMWSNEEAKLELVIDDVNVTADDFPVKKIWTYGSENTWKWYPLYRTKLSKGLHQLSVKLMASGLRIDRIHIEERDGIWK